MIDDYITEAERQLMIENILIILALIEADRKIACQPPASSRSWSRYPKPWGT